MDAAKGKQLMETCIKDSKLSDAESKLSMENKLFSQDAPMPSQNQKCYILCLYKQLNVVDGMDKIQPEGLQEYVGYWIKDQSKIAGIIKQCSETKAADKCETAYNFDKCLHEQRAA